MTSRDVLLLATDPGAGHHVVHLMGLLGEHTDFDPVLYAGTVAGDIFTSAGIPFHPAPAVPMLQRRPSEREFADLMDMACGIVSAHDPDILIVGLSNARYGYGLNEALVAAARMVRPNCKTVTLLDDRGPLDPIEGKYADHLFAFSRAICEWAEKAIGHPSVFMTGSLKHHAISLLPADTIRQRTRARMGIADGVRLVTFIAQNDEMDGHNDLFGQCASVLARRRSDLPPFELAVRVHPAAPSAGEWCLLEARRQGLTVRRDTSEDVLEVLAASDVLLSCNSGSLVDYIWLSLGGEALTAVPLYMLNARLKAWLTKMTGVWIPDLVARGLAYEADGDDPAGFEQLIVDAVQGSLRMRNSDRGAVRDAVANPFAETMVAIQRIASANMRRTTQHSPRTYGLR